MEKGSNVETKNGLVRGQRMVQCGDKEWFGKSQMWEQERIRCEDGEESIVGMVKDPVREQGMVQ